MTLSIGPERPAKTSGRPRRLYSRSELAQWNFLKRDYVAVVVEFHFA